MNFIETPEGELKPNSPMTEEEQAVAGRFVDKLIRLQVLVPAVDELRANCPLFCVEKPHEPGAYRCIADAKVGGQNACMGKDHVYLTRPDDILLRLYHGGWTAVADASKPFHNFLTQEVERKYLGCIHPIHKTEWVYRGLPMGTANSPAIACRLGNSGVCKLHDEHELFHGVVSENSWRNNLNGKGYTEGIVHGRVAINQEGLPAALVFSMVDDFMVHADTKEQAM
jgi:hypothetical protein